MQARQKMAELWRSYISLNLLLCMRLYAAPGSALTGMKLVSIFISLSLKLTAIFRSQILFLR